MVTYVESVAERNGKVITDFNEKLGELTTLTMTNQSPELYRMIGYLEGQKEAIMNIDAILKDSKVGGPKLKCENDDECQSILKTLNDIMSQNGIITLGDVKNQAGELAFDSDKIVGWTKDMEKPYTQLFSKRHDGEYVIVFVPYKTL